jgi:hypothetical protein
MMRLPTYTGLACLLALTQASAQEVSIVERSSVKPHESKAHSVKSAAAKTASLGDIQFSDPYAPPVGPSKGKRVGLPAPERSVPTDPQGGFSIRAGRDSPDAPMTGGLVFRF